jgi:hypothetical protein
MSIIRTVPSTRLINGQIINTSEMAIISETEYKTNGEDCIIVKNVSKSTIILNSDTTDHIVIKSMTNVTIKPDVGKIDENYDEIVTEKYTANTSNAGIVQLNDSNTSTNSREHSSRTIRFNRTASK